MTQPDRNRKKPVSALGLLSGGLDSMLAAELLKRLGVEVTGIIFTTPFFGSSRGEQAAKYIDIPYRVEEITVEHLAMVKAPKYGYGKNMNPCIDCHAMMFAKAGQLMEELGADFLFSGEVLGQRPMSQNSKALRSVEKLSGYDGLVLRPLSARLLPETEPEKSGLVNRESLMDIQGRSRKVQMELAEKWGIQEFPNPGGGCLLTDPGFSVRLKELLQHMPEAGATEVEKLKYGRHFRLPGASKVIVGRHKADNEALEPLAAVGDILLRHNSVPGPLTLLEGSATPEEVEKAASLTARYGKGADSGEPVEIRVQVLGDNDNARNGSDLDDNDVQGEVLKVQPMGLMELEEYRVG